MSVKVQENAAAALQAAFGDGPASPAATPRSLGKSPLRSPASRTRRLSGADVSHNVAASLDLEPAGKNAVAGEGGDRSGDLEDEDEDEEEAAMDEKAKRELAVATRCPGCFANRSLCVFAPHDFPRRHAVWIVSQGWFDNTILVLILVACVVLSLDSPLLDPASRLSRALNIIDLILTFTFLAELLIKVLANGFLFGSIAYLTSAWNWLDAGLVAISLFALTGSAT